MDSQNQNRPDMMDQLTASQLKELEFQYDEGDRQEFDKIAKNYDWSTQDIQTVWNWFDSGNRASDARPRQGNIPS